MNRVIDAAGEVIKMNLESPLRFCQTAPHAVFLLMSVAELFPEAPKPAVIDFNYDGLRFEWTFEKNIVVLSIEYTHEIVSYLFSKIQDVENFIPSPSSVELADTLRNLYA